MKARRGTPILDGSDCDDLTMVKTPWWYELVTPYSSRVVRCEAGTPLVEVSVRMWHPAFWVMYLKHVIVGRPQIAYSTMSVGERYDDGI